MFAPILAAQERHQRRCCRLLDTPEYQSLGCLPAKQFVPQLMEHLGEAYYVALLSAAELHGAAHQRPQGSRFIARNDLKKTPVVEKNSPRGVVRVASAEATALELIGYAEHCGGLDNVAVVLGELAEAIDRARLHTAAKLCPIVWVQRLGYLLDGCGRGDLAEVLLADVQKRAHVMAPLVRAKTTAGAKRLERWKLAINVHIEPDL